MTIELHPSEFAYAFAYARVTEVIGWGSEPFRPAEARDGVADDWLSQGEQRLLAAGRLVGTTDTGLNFEDDMTSAILALVDPGLVLLAQRRAGDGVRTLTVHVRDDDLVGLTRRPDGMFEMDRYATLTAAAVACAVFVGADAGPLSSEARIESDAETLRGLNRLARSGQIAAAEAGLVALGASGADAASAGRAFAAPAAAGVLSVLYCQGNAIRDAETFSVMTTPDDQTWLLFPPADPNGPMILERSSAPALAARISVGVVARLRPAA